MPRQNQGLMNYPLRETTRGNPSAGVRRRPLQWQKARRAGLQALVCLTSFAI